MDNKKIVWYVAGMIFIAIGILLLALGRNDLLNASLPTTVIGIALLVIGVGCMLLPLINSPAASFYRGNEPVIVDRSATVTMRSPKIGEVGGKRFSRSSPIIKRWRSDPKFKGADPNVDGYYMELEIGGIRGEPYLEIRPVKDVTSKWWVQPLNRDRSDPSRNLYVFNVYLHRYNEGFHLFRLWGNNKKDRICTWLFDK